MTGKSAATRSSKSSAVKKEIGKVKKEREPKQPVRVPTARRSKQKFTKALQKDVLALLQKREYQIPTEDDLAKSDKLRNLPYKQVVEFCRKQLKEFHIPKDVKKKRAGKSQGPELEGLDSSSSSSSSSDDDDDDDETPHPQLESDVEIPSDVDDDDDDETNKEKKVKKEKKHKKTKKAPANVPPQAQNTSPAAPGSANPSTNSSAPPKIHGFFGSAPGAIYSREDSEAHYLDIRFTEYYRVTMREDGYFVFMPRDSHRMPDGAEPTIFEVPLPGGWTVEDINSLQPTRNNTTQLVTYCKRKPLALTTLIA